MFQERESQKEMKQLFVDEKWDLENKLTAKVTQVASLESAIEEIQTSHVLALHDLNELLEATNKKLVS